MKRALRWWGSSAELGSIHDVTGEQAEPAAAFGPPPAKGAALCTLGEPHPQPDLPTLLPHTLIARALSTPSALKQVCRLARSLQQLCSRTASEAAHASRPPVYRLNAHGQLISASASAWHKGPRSLFHTTFTLNV
ncbi:hypothetical protein L1887_58262 [Cichorium endivia]|nr:hypothetical protein L1887_58262 [Cichorium endivia]